MRNSPYCNRFILTDTHIEDNINGIRYVKQTELESENGCRKVCENVQRKTCEVLNHFQKLRVPNRNFFEKDKFGDEVKNHKRKL